MTFKSLENGDKIHCLSERAYYLFSRHQHNLSSFEIVTKKEASTYVNIFCKRNQIQMILQLTLHFTAKCEKVVTFKLSRVTYCVDIKVVWTKVSFAFNDAKWATSKLKWCERWSARIGFMGLRCPASERFGSPLRGGILETKEDANNLAHCT